MNTFSAVCVVSRRQALSSLTAVLLAAVAVAQGEVPTGGALTGFVTPIAPGIARPDGSSAGLWAGGRNYKASFHDGMTYYPHVGPARPHQPLRWRTTSVRADGVELLRDGVPPQPSWSDLRCEYDFGAVVERYDVLLEGLEQSFVIESPVTGDLVIRGEITTPMALRDRPLQHGALTFALADGTPAVEYGAAVAFDATGRRTPVRTSADGRTVTLLVDREFLAGAAFPIVVDPLLGNALLESGAPIGSVDVLHETLSSASSQARTWVAFDRRAAAGDDDFFLIRCASGFGGTPIVAFRTIDAAWSDNDGAIALAPDAAPGGVTVTAFVSRTAGIPPLLSVHTHGVTDLVLRSGVATLSNQAYSFSRPDVGGRLDAGVRALIVFQADDVGSGLGVNTDTSEVHAVVWDADTGLNGQVAVPEFVVRSRTNRDQERPSVNQTASGQEWLVAFQERDESAPNDDWDVLVYEVDAAGVATDSGLEVEEAADVSLHTLGPRIAGSRGRYVLGYTVQTFEQIAPKPANIAGEWLRAQRIDFDHAAGSGSLPHPAVTLRQRPTPALQLGGIAHDHVSQDHWCVTMRRTGDELFEAVKLGYRGEVVETGTILSNPALSIVAGGVAFNGNQRQFLIAFAADAGNAGDLYGGRMVYDAVAPPTTYGLACGTGFMSGLTEMVHEQQVGAENLTIELRNAPYSGTGLLLVALGRAAIPLGNLAPGCSWLLDTATFLGAVPVVVVGGDAAVTLALPEGLPPFLLNFQWAYEVPGANPVNLLFSEGLEVEIGR